MIGGIPRAGFSFFMEVFLFKFAPKVKTGNAVPVFLLICFPLLLFIGVRAWWFDFLVVMLIFPAMLFIAASWQPTGLLKRISFNLGRISYPLYIIHAPILYWGWLVIDRNIWSPILQAIAWGLVATLALLISASLPIIYDEPVRRLFNRAINSSAQNKN